MSRLPPLAEMRRAYLAGDRSYDGVFFLGVKTTGIFCRPVCPARKPLPKNVIFFATAQEALASGFRACKRCRPGQADDQPGWVHRLLGRLEREPGRRIPDGELRASGLDPATVRRHFRRRFGMTFQAFARGRRMAAALGAMQEHPSVEHAMFDSAFESSSGFRDAFRRLLGTTPARQVGQAWVRVDWLASPLGPLVAGATDEGVCLLEFAEPARLTRQLQRLGARLAAPVLPGSHPHLSELRRQLDEYFAGSRRQFDLPLVYPGTDFQRRVWQELLRIRYGQTRSYEELAVALGCPQARRAVGTANGANRLAILIPCHRVVRKNGALGGYGGGLRRKQFLLDLERQSVDPMAVGNYHGQPRRSDPQVSLLA